MKGPDELRYLGKTINGFLEEQQQKKEELQWQAKYDSLTQVANKGETERYIQKKLDCKGARGALIFVDIDDFKHINDNYGHAEGDRAIQWVVDVIRRSFRDNDFIGRFGGDEFILWIDGISRDRASYIRERIKELNEKLQEDKGLSAPVSISAGVTFCISGEQYEDVLKRADQALYMRKSKYQAKRLSGSWCQRHQCLHCKRPQASGLCRLRHKRCRRDRKTGPSSYSSGELQRSYRKNGKTWTCDPEG